MDGGRVRRKKIGKERADSEGERRQEMRQGSIGDVWTVNCHRLAVTEKGVTTPTLRRECQHLHLEGSVNTYT